MGKQETHGERFAGLAEVGLRFHQSIFEIVGNPGHKRLFEELTSEIRMIIGIAGRIDDDPHHLADIHLALLETLSVRDPDKIRRELEYHISVASHVTWPSFQTSNRNRSDTSSYRAINDR